MTFFKSLKTATAISLCAISFAGVAHADAIYDATIKADLRVLGVVDDSGFYSFPGNTMWNAISGDPFTEIFLRGDYQNNPDPLNQSDTTGPATANESGSHTLFVNGLPSADPALNDGFIGFPYVEFGNGDGIKLTAHVDGSANAGGTSSAFHGETAAMDFESIYNFDLYSDITVYLGLAYEFSLSTEADVPNESASAIVHASIVGGDLNFDLFHAISGTDDLYGAGYEYFAVDFEDLFGFGHLDFLVDAQGVAAVPAPGALPIFAFGIGALALARRRKAKTA